MMLIHGRIESVSLEQANTEIVFTLIDNSKHIYLCDDNCIFFIVQEPNAENPTEYDTLKYITLCPNIDNYSFGYQDNKLTTEIKMGDITYKNNFNL